MLLLRDRATARLLAKAERAYSDRRRALVAALAARGIASTGDTGLGVWVPLADEAAAVRELLVQGWAVSPGERYRFKSPPGIRITTARLEPDEAEDLADARRRPRSRSGRHVRGLDRRPARAGRRDLTPIAFPARATFACRVSVRLPA